MIQDIKVLAMDVDGTMTDGKIHIGEFGEIFKSFNVCDGLGIKMLKEKSIIPIIITGRKSSIVIKRAEELGIDNILQGIQDKETTLNVFCINNGISMSEVAYIGDDVNDLGAMLKCGLTACPNDAHEKVRKVVNYICKKCGGQGAVREFIDYILEE